MKLLLALVALLSSYVQSQQLDARQPGSASANSFELPLLTSPLFVLNPPVSATQPWTWTATQGGIARMGSVYDAPIDNQPPHGSQYAFLTTLANRQIADMSTTLSNLVSGQRYALTFTWGLRASIPGSSLPGYQTRSQLNVSIDGVNVYGTRQNLTDDYGWSTGVTTSTFTAGGATAQLTFSVRSLSTAEHTVLVDAIEVGPGLPASGVFDVSQLSNFESPYPLTNGFQYNPPVTALQQWTFAPSGLGGIAGIGSPFESGPTRFSPSGNQFAFMQTMNNNRRVSNMSAHITGLITGQTYRVKGFIATRYEGGASAQTQSQVSAYMSGQRIWQSEANVNGANNWQPFSASFVAPVMNGPLVFNTIATGDNDRSVLIDSVMIEPINAQQPVGRFSASLDGHSTAASFEAPVLNPQAYGQGLSLQPFIYNPSIEYNQPWSFSNRLGGIARIGSPWDAVPATPADGVQFAYLQTSPSGALNQRNSSMWTTVTDLTIGEEYAVTFSWGLRAAASGSEPGYITQSQMIVKIGNTVVYRSSHNLSDADGWQNGQLSTQSWRATQTSIPLTFELWSESDNDHTFLFDAISVGAPRPLEDFLNVGENADFDSPFPVSTVVWNPPQNILQQWAWEPLNMGGIATQGAFNAPRPPTPSNFAVLKTTAISLTARMLTLLQGIIVGQTYRISFWMANRNVGASQEYLKLDGRTVWQSNQVFNSESAGFMQFSVTFVATGISSTFVFETASSSSNEQYVFIDSVLVIGVSQPPTGQLNINLGGASVGASMEYPHLEGSTYGAGITMQDYKFNPSLSPLSPWTFTQGRGGIAFMGSMYRSPEPSAPPAGEQWAFLMTSPENVILARRSNMSATLSGLTAGRDYVVTFSWGLRYTNTQTNVRITVNVNGVPVFQSPQDLADDFGWGPQETTRAFIAPGATATLEFVLSSSSDVETTVLFDAVAVAQPPPNSGTLAVGTLGNFESPCCALYTYEPAVTAVQPFFFPGRSGGIARTGSPFDTRGNIDPPSQSGYAYLQNVAARPQANMTTTLTGLIAGQTYTISFSMSTRWDNAIGATTRQQLFIYIGDVLVFTSRPNFNSTIWEPVSANFVARSSNSPLFFNVISSDANDRSLLIDSVLVQPIGFVAPGTLNVLLGGSSIPNSFESPNLDGTAVGLGITMQSYVYNPMKTLTQPWEWTTLQGGIAIVGSPFDAPAPSAPPAGKQYAWLQTSPNHATGRRTSAMWTTLANLVVGQRYIVVFTWGIRGANVCPNGQTCEPGLLTHSQIVLTLNNAQIFASRANLTDTAGWGEQEQSQIFTAAGTTALLNFTVTSLEDRDHTILIDAVDVAPPLPDAGTMSVGTLGGFESPFPIESYVANPAVTALQPWVWVPRNKGGIATFGQGFDAPAPVNRPPSPNQFAVIRLNAEMSTDPHAGNMSATITGMIVGQSYTLSFYMAYKFPHTMLVMRSQERVYMDDRQIWASAADVITELTWTRYTVAFIASSTAGSLTFSTVSTTSNERMILIDSVQITQTSASPPAAFLDALATNTSPMASFEVPSLLGVTYGADVTMQDYLFNPPISADQPWTFTPGQGGIAQVGSIYQAAEPRQPPHGSQFAILVTTPTNPVASMSTTINHLVVGTVYQIEFEWGVRAAASQTRSRITVNMGNNNQLYRSAENLTDTAGWGNIVITAPFTATATTAPLQININSLSAQDDALLIDTVVVNFYTPRSSTGGNGGNGGASSSSSSSLGGGAIAGIVIGVIAGAVCLAAILFFMCCSRGSKSQKWQSQNDHVEPSRNTDMETSEVHDTSNEVEMT